MFLLIIAFLLFVWVVDIAVKGFIFALKWLPALVVIGIIVAMLMS